MSGVRMGFTVQQNGVTPFFEQRLRGLAPQAFTTAGDLLGAALVSDVVDRFLKSVEPDGTAWEPSQRALEEGGKTLIDSTNLMKSITHDATPGGVEVGTGEIYGAIHQFGGKAGRGKNTELVARRWLGIDAPQEAIMRAVYTQWLS